MYWNLTYQNSDVSGFSVLECLTIWISYHIGNSEVLELVEIQCIEIPTCQNFQGIGISGMLELSEVQHIINSDILEFLMN